ncbi:MAG: Gfo/Idh/MocA family oxidoreductase [Verrucomicrobia bacterium]|nr:Gfo/Idh/MocA family oxidoreductase [Verrucomicrobiota bacterium]MDA1066934.1 Gfo/Idh/MocA family oxidoreductase [Verrucomicrobiota bacterium]
MSVSPTQPLRVAIIGAGYFSQFQYEAWTRIPEVTIVAACNRSVDKAKEKCAQYGIPRFYSDWKEMVDEEKPDFVDIITPPPTHLEICKYLAKRNIHMICQKPLTPSYEESVQLVGLLQSTEARFMVHENWRWQPWYRKIKALMDEGKLGELFSIHFRMRVGDGWGDNAYLDRQPYFRDYPKLLMFETGVHFLDTFRYLGGEVSSLYAKLNKRNPVIAGEDSGIVICNFSSGATATLDANRYNEAETDDARFTFGVMRIDGSEGHLQMDLAGDLTFKPLGGLTQTVSYEHPRINFASDCCFHLQRHFVEQLLNDLPFDSEVEDYLKTLSLVEACYESSATNQVVNL